MLVSNSLRLSFSLQSVASLVILVFLFSWLAAGPLYSQESEVPPTDIFISGLPFQDSVQEAPQSASLIDAEQLQEREVQSFQDTLEQLPGVSFVGGSSRPRFFLIRGVGELEQYENAPNPSVAVVVDGIDFSGLGIPLPLFDIGQLEILRGPQGLRYGANGLAGALNIISAAPSAQPGGNLQLSSGNDQFLSTGAAVSGPVPGTDNKLLLRISAFHLEQNGFRDNQFLNRDNTNQRDESFARMKLRYQSDTKSSAELVGWVSDSNNGYDAFSIDNSFHTRSDKPGEDDPQSYAGSLTTSTTLSENVLLESVTAALRARQDYSFDGDWGNNSFWAPYDPYDYFSDSNRLRKMFSQEFRFSSDDSEYVHGEESRWLAGVFAQNLSEDTDTSEFADSVQYDFLASDYRARSAALFAQYEQALGSGLALSLGGRAERRLAEYSDSRGAEFGPSYNMPGGQLSLSYDLSTDTRTYLSVSRGFKGGGFNAGPSVPEARRQYDPEYLWNYETGLKGSWLEKTLTFDLALFYQQRKDQQLKFAVQDDPSDPLAFTYITESSAKGHSYGLELSSVYQLNSMLRIFVNGSLLESEFDDLPIDSPDLSGRSFSHAPNWQYSSGLLLQATEQLSGRIELTGRDRFYFDDSHNQRSQPYHLLNASVAYQLQNLRLSIWARNLTDERYAIRGFFFGNEPPDFENKEYYQLGDPRTFGLTLRYLFNL